jgi:GNAT superfamily N-acetyltransferase
MELIDIARLEEFRRARGASEIADEYRPLTGGGVALKGKRGSWINYAVGLGLSGPVSATELVEVTEWWAKDGIEPRLEVTPFVESSVWEVLKDLRYSVRECYNVMFRELSTSHPVRPIMDPSPGLELREVDPHDPAQIRAYGDAVIRGFKPPGAEPTEVEHDLTARFIRSPRAVTVAAYLNGKVVGGGSTGIDGQIAGLLGASVLPEYRRQGIQQALVAARLNAAAARGVTLATISSRPGISTERNARRMGFTVAYTKVILTRPDQGLLGVG